MSPKLLYAKSADKDGVRLTLMEHTRDVVDSAEALYNKTSADQLRSLGLDPLAWLGRFRRDLLIAALLHDLGKANSCFQLMVGDSRQLVSQPIRHEAVSFWIARRPPVRGWLVKAIGDESALECVLWAIAGHHRKFPPGRAESEPMRVYLGHEGFSSTLRWGAQRLGLPEPPRLNDEEIRFTPPRLSVELEFNDAEADAVELSATMARVTPELLRYVALLKASLIAADVAGSIRRRGAQPMAEWISVAFNNVPSMEQLDDVVATKLSGGKLHGFQEAVGRAVERVVFVRAGCGSGKTLAAYHWAARTAQRLGRNLRVFFCYPTTGTATEGYRDYLKDVELDAALIHGRAEVDMALLSLGDDERGPDRASTDVEDEPGQAELDAAGSLEHWSTPLVSCTVDTVLGLMQNNRRGVYLWPSLAASAIVFDEIHSYDRRLFAALLRFLKEARGIPCLLMTASLPSGRFRRIIETVSSIDESVAVIPGPETHEMMKRYRKVQTDDPWHLVSETLGAGGKVLWVVNTVDEAISLYADQRARKYSPLIYHSRFRYCDRVLRHGEVISRFKSQGPVLAFSSQVAEMSLDLSADLLVTQLAPIAALIQRLGRLNRRASGDDPWPFIVLMPSSAAPYEPEDFCLASRWLDSLGDEGLSQRDLATAWTDASDAEELDLTCAWIDGGFETLPHPLREGTPGIEIILQEDAPDVRSRARAPELVRIPMTIPWGREWKAWPDLSHCKVPPSQFIDYDPRRGARWIR